MARTLTKAKPIRDVFTEGILDAVVNSSPAMNYDSEWWKEKPVSSQEFCTNWLGESLYPEQENLVNAMIGIDQFEFELKYDECHAYWGKGCFGGKEKISLLDGTEKTFEELSKEYLDGEFFWVYSIDKNDNIVAGKAHSSRITKYVDKMIYVMLDNGEIIRSTLDHLYETRNGKYKQAQNLQLGDSLMPLYRSVNKDGYEEIYNPADSKKYCTHRFIYGKDKIKKGEVIHHDDFDKKNNCPNNLFKFSSQSKHSLFHHINERKKENESDEYKKNSINKRSTAAKLAWRRHRNKYMESFSKPGCKIKKSKSSVEKWKNPEYIKFQKQTMKNICNTAEYKKKISDIKKEWYDENKNNKEFQQWLKDRSKKGNDAKRKKIMNHKVKSVKIIKLKHKIPVYDITVEKYHNFALSAGIFVHNSGKDRTISKLQVYTIYKLMCLKNPQKFLREKYGCSIGNGDAIDLVNMSINARQAQNVYFKKFKQLIKACKNPKTKKNWFAENGVDLRDGYDLQNTEARFQHSITSHSLNSETNTGEGLNIFLATIDEFGSFAFDKAFELLDAIRDTVISRFSQVGKVVVISYKYYNNDPMDVLFKKEKGNPRVYSSKKATWEVNLQMTKTKLAEQFKRNPEKSSMTYECKGGDSIGGYVGKKYMISKMFTPEFENPIKGNLISVDGSLLPTLEFKDWFKGSDGKMYAIHLDMATGKKIDGNDCAGFGMVHVEKMFPQLDSKMKKDLQAEGIMVDFISDDPELKIIRKGIVLDLLLQLTAKHGTELQFSDVRKFIMRLKKYFNFNIIFVTYDGWQCALGSTQVKLLNGETIRIDEIKESKWIYSYDLKNKKIVPSQCKPVRKTGEKVSVYEVLLDNGEKVRFTPEHLFLMRNGKYKKLLELKTGDSLMPFYYRNIEMNNYYNHKVVSIKFYGYEDVYDIEVPKYHNFALSAGIFVHNSKDSIQILNHSGINADQFSVDKNNEAYDTWKELMYQQLVKTYPNLIAEREAKELIVDEKGKVDHPSESWDRYITEGTNKGSKDVMDALVGASKIAFDNFSLDSGIFFG